MKTHGNFEEANSDVQCVRLLKIQYMFPGHMTLIKQVLSNFLLCSVKIYDENAVFNTIQTGIKINHKRMKVISAKRVRPDKQ